MEFWLIVNGLITKSVDFNKLEHCPYMWEGEGSILGTSELKKLLKTHHIKELVSRKVSGLLRIIC